MTEQIKGSQRKQKKRKAKHPATRQTTYGWYGTWYMFLQQCHSCFSFHVPDALRRSARTQNITNSADHFLLVSFQHQDSQSRISIIPGTGSVTFFFVRLGLQFTVFCSWVGHFREPVKITFIIRPMRDNFRSLLLTLTRYKGMH